MKPYLVKWNNKVTHAGDNGNNAANTFTTMIFKVVKMIFKQDFEVGTRGTVVFEDHNNKEQMIITIETKKIETKIPGNRT